MTTETNGDETDRPWADGWGHTSAPVGRRRMEEWLQERGECPACGCESLEYYHWRGCVSVVCEECDESAEQMGVMYFVRREE